ncbi:hypothetical protein JQC67_10875 [Aurantibacter crassamenti]|uniref:hypothetical protein n=1 Tax=Aurantibacter crassamenti TaxID=1837375 RepID=UPI00193AD532|nr:hypothetical protein [Aurantibacter crassamenti]MBM1106642.1 hypothetical protein [Aurantibacter crassamenti]
MHLSEENTLIEEIIKSKSFGNSTTYANLLRYLVKCTIANDIPKETTIASEIFGKKNFDPSQSTLIRVYVYNLRKKLNTYYLNEGIHNKKRIIIPKGSYGIEIVESKLSTTSSKNSFNKNWVILILGILLFSLTLYSLLRTPNYKKAFVTKNELWADLIKSNLPKTLILGDLFIFSEFNKITEQSRTIREVEVNSSQEFSDYKINNVDSNVEIEPLSYTHLILGSALWIKDLSQIFYSINRDFTIRTMSRFNPKQLQEYDIIVVGMHKTLGVFRAFHKNSKFEYDTIEDAFLFKEDATDELITYKPTGIADSYHTDYGIITKYPGPNNNSIYQFSGIWDTGATQSLKNFTDEKLVSAIENELRLKFHTIPKYYEVLIEVKGIDRMELSSKILYLNRLDEPQN